MKKTTAALLAAVLMLSSLSAGVFADVPAEEESISSEPAQYNSLEFEIASEADVDAAAAAVLADSTIDRLVLKAPAGAEHIDFALLSRLRSATDIALDYRFELFGQEVDIDTEELIYTDVRIGNDGVQVFYELIPCMQNLKRLVLDDCQVDNEIMAELRDSFEDTVKVVWRIYWDSGSPRTSTLTDAVMLRASATVTSKNISNLNYCRDVRFIDMGHSPQLYNIEFVRSMPHLQVLIIVDSAVSSLEPLADCPELLMLEIVACTQVTDLSPLANCPLLRLINFSACMYLKDITPLYGLTDLERVFAKSYSVPVEQFDKLAELRPDCWVHYGPTAESSVSANYSVGWRLDAPPLVTAAWYDELHLLFGIGKELYSEGGYFSTKTSAPYEVPLDELDYFALPEYFDCA